MINMYVISAMRKGATKPTVVSCTEGNYLSVCQIYQSTDDVESYQVGLIGQDFQIRDKYLPTIEGVHNPWSKWKPIEKEENVSN